MFEVREVPATAIDEVNRMCLPHGVKDGPALEAVLRESAAAHARAAAMGARVFAAFLAGKAVGRIEVMPVEAAPLPLEGEDLWVIRCLWVLPPGEGKGIGKALVGHALDAAGGSAGVASLTFPDWIPVSFFEKHGFTNAETRGDHILLLRANRPAARVSLVPVKKAHQGNDASVHVEAVLSARCPWLMLTYRRMLEIAREMSPRVVTAERVITKRADALAFGEENIYIDGQPLEGAPSSDAFRQQLQQHLQAKGLL
ncbi:MAG: GNAT family N-acetyltransferase [Bacillota bacterium]|nr:GNAT family N-acetyltransferase [Bacillota bacterium]